MSNRIREDAVSNTYRLLAYFAVCRPSDHFVVVGVFFFFQKKAMLLMLLSCQIDVTSVQHPRLDLMMRLFASANIPKTQPRFKKYC